MLCFDSVLSPCFHFSGNGNFVTGLYLAWRRFGDRYSTLSIAKNQ